MSDREEPPQDIIYVDDSEQDDRDFHWLKDAEALDGWLSREWGPE